MQEGDAIRMLEPEEPDADNKKMMMMAPRSHAKSSIFSVAYPLWMIGKNPNIRIVIVSSTQSQSQSFLREITSNMENNERYKNVFGNRVPSMPDKWTSSEIIVDRDNVNLKDPTVSATSIGGMVLSRRADIIVCDDILSQENTRTSDQREKVREWFFNVLLPVLEPYGKLIVIGTAWNEEDLYHQLMGDTTFDVRKRYDAEEDTMFGEESMWPSRWPLEVLHERKESMGSSAYNQAYRNIVYSAEDAVFKVEWTNHAKQRGENRRLLKSFEYPKWDMGKVRISMGVDLAISKKEGSDYTAIAVVAQVVKDGTKIPLWLEEEKYSPAETRERIIEVYELFGPQVVIVENNAYQEALRQDLADTTSMPIRGYTTGGEKFDPDIGINSLAVEFENGKWILPYDSDDGHTVSMVDSLVDGMLRFPSGHTRDILMAAWFANTGIRQLTNKKKEGAMKVGRHNLFSGA